jgi:hypothetical protein
VAASRTEARISEARRVLGEFNFDAERSNERSALVLLALLELSPDQAWSRSASPMLRTVEIMDWLRQVYDKDYRPNTRETIRRQTLHQFVDAGLAVLNPDDPTRAVNSPKSCYQINARAFEVLQRVGTAAYADKLAKYLVERPGLIAKYARQRQQDMIPVTLHDGTSVELTPGGQNVLLKDMIEQFCPRWTPGGRILYIGDAGREDPVFAEDELHDLGLDLDKHGKFPDLIVHLPERNWLVLLEAASSHGPVDAKRHDELRALFARSSAGLVFVSCFPSRAEMRKYLSAIAWETEVWCGDAPSHLIHFNGERFLGPYPTEL